MVQVLRGIALQILFQHQALRAKLKAHNSVYLPVCHILHLHQLRFLNHRVYLETRLMVHLCLTHLATKLMHLMVKVLDKKLQMELLWEEHILLLVPTVLIELFIILPTETVLELPSSPMNQVLKNKIHPELLWKLHSLRLRN